MTSGPEATDLHVALRDHRALDVPMQRLEPFGDRAWQRAQAWLYGEIHEA